MTLGYRLSSFLIASFCCIVASCSRHYDFGGVVLDGDGRPIAGATFAMNPSDWPKPDWSDPNIVSGADGAFRTGWGSATGVTFFRFTTRCQGYDPDCRIVRGDDVDLRIVLSRSQRSDEPPNL